MKTKPYQIKHKATGLYYQPSVNGTNLSANGKVYLTRRNPLTVNDNMDYIGISIMENSYAFKKHHETLGLEVTNNPWHQFFFRIPKSEFEQEFL